MMLDTRIVDVSIINKREQICFNCRQCEEIKGFITGDLIKVCSECNESIYSLTLLRDTICPQGKWLE